MVGGQDSRSDLTEVLAYDPRSGEGGPRAWTAKAPLKQPCGKGWQSWAWAWRYLRWAVVGTVQRLTTSSMTRVLRRGHAWVRRCPANGAIWLRRP